MNIDFNDYLVRTGPYMTTDQIKELINSGFAIGAHSIDHPLYSSLSLENQLCQTIESIKTIREKFGLNYKKFFPHSDHGVSKNFFNQINKDGLIDITFGTAGMINDCIPNSFERISLEKPLMPAKRIIPLQFARQIYRIMKGSNNIIRKEI